MRVLWQYSQTARIEPADLKTTGAPQEGQVAEKATRLRSTQFFEQFRLLGLELGRAENALLHQAVQLFQGGAQLVGRQGGPGGWRARRRRADAGLPRPKADGLAQRLPDHLPQADTRAQTDADSGTAARVSRRLGNGVGRLILGEALQV